MGTEDVSYQQKFVAFEVDFILLFRLGIFNSTLLNDTHEGYWDQCGTYCFNVCSVTIYNFFRSSTCWVHGWQIGKKITIFESFIIFFRQSAAMVAFILPKHFHDFHEKISIYKSLIFSSNCTRFPFYFPIFRVRTLECWFWPFLGLVCFTQCYFSCHPS